MTKNLNHRQNSSPSSCQRRLFASRNFFWRLWKFLTSVGAHKILVLGIKVSITSCRGWRKLVAFIFSVNKAKAIATRTNAICGDNNFATVQRGSQETQLSHIILNIIINYNFLQAITKQALCGGVSPPVTQRPTRISATTSRHNLHFHFDFLLEAQKGKFNGTPRGNNGLSRWHDFQWRKCKNKFRKFDFSLPPQNQPTASRLREKVHRMSLWSLEICSLLVITPVSSVLLLLRSI